MSLDVFWLEFVVAVVDLFCLFVFYGSLYFPIRSRRLTPTNQMKLLETSFF